MQAFDREYRVPPTLSPERQKELEEKYQKEKPLLAYLFPEPEPDGVTEFEEVRIIECMGVKWYYDGLLHMAMKEEWKQGDHRFYTKCNRWLRGKVYRPLRLRHIAAMRWRQGLHSPRHSTRIRMCSQCIARARKEKLEGISV